MVEDCLVVRADRNRMRPTLEKMCVCIGDVAERWEKQSDGRSLGGARRRDTERDVIDVAAAFQTDGVDAASHVSRQSDPDRLGPASVFEIVLMKVHRRVLPWCM